MIAIVSDIHANIEAFEAVLKDIDQKGIKREEIICLGDVVGYGPNPAECVEIARQFKFVLMGNHDEAMLYNAIGFSEMAKEAIEWTRRQMKPQWFSTSSKKTHWKFIADLPTTRTEQDILYVHGSPREPTTEYILKNDTEMIMGSPSDKLVQIFNMFPRLCFVGHTHEPGVITAEVSPAGAPVYKFITPAEMNYSFELEDNKKYIINDGSVGQPRDGDNRACYVTIDGKTLNYHRVQYDYTATMNKIFKIPELDRRLGERLATGALNDYVSR